MTTRQWCLATLLALWLPILTLACQPSAAVPPTPQAAGARFADIRSADDASQVNVALSPAAATAHAGAATAIIPILTAIATVKPPPATATAIVVQATALAATSTAIRAISTVRPAEPPQPAAPAALMAVAVGTIIPMVPGQIIAPDCDTPLTGSLNSITCTTPTPEPPTPVPAATAEPTMPPVVTAVPTSPPVTATPAAMIEGVPLCADHDPTRWHPLVKRNASNAIACTYGHTHFDDPHAADAELGPVAAWWGGSQEISYPWQTSSSLGPENSAKHNIYKSVVVKDVACKAPGGGPLSFDTIREQVHADGNLGATVRFHSFAVEVRGCDSTDPSWHGTLATGGWMDYGYLAVRQADGSFKHVPLPGDPTPLSGNQRGHGGTAGPGAFRGGGVWYGSRGLIVPVLGIIKEDWGPVDGSDPAKALFYPDANGNAFNGSWIEPVHLLGITVPAYLDQLDGKKDGFVTFEGFTNKAGQIGSCSVPVGPDCVPLKITNMKVGSYSFRAGVVGLGNREYDLKSPVTGKSLVKYPN